MTYQKQKVEVWGNDSHPSKGMAQPARKPFDRLEFIKTALQGEFGKVIAANGVPAASADQLHLVVQNFLADQLRQYVKRRYLIDVEIAGGMTLREAIDTTASVLGPELARRRLARKVGAAAERRWGT